MRIKFWRKKNLEFWRKRTAWWAPHCGEVEGHNFIFQIFTRVNLAAILEYNLLTSK